MDMQKLQDELRQTCVELATAQHNLIGRTLQVGILAIGSAATLFTLAGGFDSLVTPDKIYLARDLAATTATITTGLMFGISELARRSFRPTRVSSVAAKVASVRG